MNSPSFWSVLAERRLKRRSAIKAAASFAGAGLLWAACGGDETDLERPNEGGVLRYGTTSPFAGLDPQTEAGTGLAIAARLYGYLIHIDPRDEAVIYDQADSIEQPDPNTYIFKLRSGVRYHDVAPVGGRTLVADDVVASIERFRKNALAPTRIFHTDVLDKVEAIDELTLRVTTRQPYRYTLSYLGDIAAGAILPTELVESGASLYTQAAGTGPFQLSSTQPGNRVTLPRHDAYFRSPIPYLDAMEWQVFDSNAAKLDAMTRHTVDVITAGSRDELEALTVEEPQIELTAEVSLASTALGMRIDRPPFNDPRVREAIDLGLDRQALVDYIASGNARVVGPVNPALMNGSWSIPDPELYERYRLDLAAEERRTQARELLVAAGALGANLSLRTADVPQLIRLAEVITLQMAAIGLPLTVERVDLLTWFNDFRNGNFHLTLIAHLPYESADVPLRFFHSRGPDGTGNPFAFSDSNLDALVERSWTEQDPDVAGATALEVQRSALEARPMLPLFTAGAYSAAWSQVQNRRPGLLGSLAQFNYEQWLSDASD